MIGQHEKCKVSAFKILADERDGFRLGKGALHFGKTVLMEPYLPYSTKILGNECKVRDKI